MSWMLRRQPVVWRDHTLEKARRAPFPQRAEQADSGTLVRMTRDEDADSRGWFRPVQRAPSSSQICTVKLVWRVMKTTMKALRNLLLMALTTHRS